MKAKWITPEIVRLAKRLRELGYWKEIRQGDWYLPTKAHKFPYLHMNMVPYDTNHPDNSPCPIPIPTLTEILDWLAEHTKETAVDMPTLHCDKISAGDVWICWIDKGEYYVGDTPGEAAMLAMLKIMEVENE